MRANDEKRCTTHNICSACRATLFILTLVVASDQPPAVLFVLVVADADAALVEAAPLLVLELGLASSSEDKPTLAVGGRRLPRPEALTSTSGNGGWPTTAASAAARSLD